MLLAEASYLHPSRRLAGKARQQGCWLVQHHFGGEGEECFSIRLGLQKGELGSKVFFFPAGSLLEWGLAECLKAND